MPAKKRDRSYKGTREPELVKARQDAFIAAYGECGSIRAACQASEVSRSAYYGWMNNNVQGFKEKFATARDMFREMLQDIAVERVKTQKPNDNPVLLIALLNAHYPELYKKDAQVTNAGKEIMEEWKKFLSEYNKPSKENPKISEVEQQQKNAIDEVEKILSKKRNNDDS